MKNNDGLNFKYKSREVVNVALKKYNFFSGTKEASLRRIIYMNRMKWNGGKGSKFA